MISERLRRLVPYTPGEQPQGREYIKLNTNENPYPPAPEVFAALSGFDPAVLRRYPDPSASRLREAVAAEVGLSRDLVFAGNGSDEVLSFAFFSFFEGGRGPLLLPEFTYSFYPVFCDFYGIPLKRIPLEPDLSFDPRRFVGEPSSCGAAFANPNAPTGIGVARREIELLLERYPRDRVILVDEAYVDFGGESVVGLVESHENLLVVQTFSKSRALAGMRLGFAFGAKPLIAALEAAKDAFNSYPLDAVAQAVGIAAAKASAYYREMNRKVIATRERFSRSARDLGFRVLPSSANFVLASLPARSGRELYSSLKERGILVRHFDIQGIRDFVRVTIGTDAEMDALLAQMRALADDRAP